MGYASRLPRDTGQQAREIVQELKPFGDTFLATIEWIIGTFQEKVVIGNLAKVGGKGLALD